MRHDKKASHGVAIVGIVQMLQDKDLLGQQVQAKDSVVVVLQGTRVGLYWG